MQNASDFLTGVFEDNMCWSVFHRQVQDRETLLVQGGQRSTMLHMIKK